MSETLKCHMCGGTTDYYCCQCNEPVCEDCCVLFTLQNQCDETRCQSCQDGFDVQESRAQHKRWEAEDAEKKKRKHRSDLAKIRYWKPENVEKRRAAKEARKKAAAELATKHFNDSVKIVSEMFRGW